MNHSEKLDQLVTSLVACQFPNIQFTRTVSTGKFSYRYAELSAIVEKTKPELTQHNLAITQLMTANGTLETVLLHTSGQWLSGESILPIGPSSTPQEIGGAISYAKRYGWCAILGIVADDDDDDASAATAAARRTVPSPGQGGTPPPRSGPPSPAPIPVKDFSSLKRDLESTTSGPAGREDRLRISKSVLQAQKEGKLNKEQHEELRKLYAEKERQNP